MKSQVDDTQVVIVKAPAGDVELLIGGHPAIELTADADASLSLDAAHSDGTLMGKRYTRDAGDIELLITKAGAASLSVDGETLAIQESKPLPSSD
jgi:hypothetical protein